LFLLIWRYEFLTVGFGSGWSSSSIHALGLNFFSGQILLLHTFSSVIFLLLGFGSVRFLICVHPGSCSPLFFFDSALAHRVSSTHVFSGLASARFIWSLPSFFTGQIFLRVLASVSGSWSSSLARMPEASFYRCPDQISAREH
jgi:hypothetical protein